MWSGSVYPLAIITPMADSSDPFPRELRAYESAQPLGPRTSLFGNSVAAYTLCTQTTASACALS